MSGHHSTASRAGLTALAALAATSIWPGALNEQYTRAPAPAAYALENAWARLGFYGIIAGTTLFTLDFGLEGMGRAVALSAMEAAAEADQASIYGFVIGLTLISHPVFGLMVTLYWGSLALFGVAIIEGKVYPKWTGWALLALATANAVGAGIPYSFWGASMTVDMVFAAVATLSALVVLVLGIGMLRRRTPLRPAVTSP